MEEEEPVDRFSEAPEEWNAFVRAQESWTHFHLYEWKEVIESVFGHETEYLCCRDDRGDLVGVLPLTWVRGFLFGDFLVSMPFVNYGGPLGAPQAIRTLVDAADRRARELGDVVLELRSPRRLELDFPVSERKVSVLLDIPEEGPGRLWEELPGSRQRQIRRAREEGTTVHFGHEQLGPFYEVFSRHMRTLGTPAQSRGFFEEIAQEFGDDVWIGVAYLQGEPAAGGFGLTWQSQVELTWVSDRIELRDSYPNMLLYWAFMERAAEAGLDTFNFGRSTKGSGPHRFKRQWGGRDHQLRWYQGGDSDRTGTPSPDDSRYSWGPKVWRKLPLALTRILGPRIVKYIP